MNINKKIFITSTLVAAVVLIVLSTTYIIQKKEDIFPIFVNYSQHNAITSLIDEEKLDPKKPTLALFHSKTCSGCKEFMPVYKLMMKKYKNDYNFALLDVDDMNNIPLMRGNVGGIPCLYIFDPYIGNKIFLSLSTIGTVSNLEYEISRYLKIRSYLDIEKLHEDHIKTLEQYKKQLTAVKQ